MLLKKCLNCCFIGLLGLGVYEGAFGQGCASLTTNGKIYKTILIGNQCWMAENLSADNHTQGVSSTYDANNSYLTSEEKLLIGSKYGRLYDYDAAVSLASNISGWRLPSDEDWQVLRDYLGGEGVAGKKLKAGGGSGFEALFGGNQDREGVSYNVGASANFWTSSKTVTDGGYAWYYFISGYDNLYRYGSNLKDRFSVRLIKNN